MGGEGELGDEVKDERESEKAENSSVEKMRGGGQSRTPAAQESETVKQRH